MDSAPILELFPTLPEVSLPYSTIDVDSFFQEMQFMQEEYNYEEILKEILSKEPRKKRETGKWEKERKKIFNPSPDYKDVSAYLNYPQHVAAEKLGMASSTFSKRFKEAANVKWPFRLLQKIDKRIESLLMNKHKGDDTANLIDAVVKKRNEITAPIFVRTN